MQAFDYKLQNLAPLKSFKRAPELEMYVPGHRTCAGCGLSERSTDSKSVRTRCCTSRWNRPRPFEWWSFASLR